MSQDVGVVPAVVSGPEPDLEPDLDGDADVLDCFGSVQFAAAIDFVKQQCCCCVGCQLRWPVDAEVASGASGNKHVRTAVDLASIADHEHQQHPTMRPLQVAALCSEVLLPDELHCLG